MSKHKDDNEMEVDADSIEEIREILLYAKENRSWLEVEEALELLNDLLGYENDEDDEDDEAPRRNHLEE